METTNTLQDNKARPNALQPLSTLKAGEKGIVRQISGGMGFLKKLINIGIRTGSTVKVLNTSAGPIIIAAEGTKAAIGKGVASKILLEVIKE
ncbi:MAG: ferrous iron transport protein A [Deltaproteobacteria bacterium]|nr:ferrous iron transport protein A [Deltaproteobacteria bacterium]MCL5277749.1 ferrous iron transport protein A [Deltaproteobacteria bacterium]